MDRRTIGCNTSIQQTTTQKKGTIDTYSNRNEFQIHYAVKEARLKRLHAYCVIPFTWHSGNGQKKKKKIRIWGQISGCLGLGVKERFGYGQREGDAGANGAGLYLSHGGVSLNPDMC